MGSIVAKERMFDTGTNQSLLESFCCAHRVPRQALEHVSDVDSWVSFFIQPRNAPL